MKTDWDNRFLDLAKHISIWSKDENTKVGAVIVDSDKRIVSVGYNGLPAGAKDNIEHRQGRPQKYMYFEHAERNSIYNSARIGVSTKGCVMYCTMFPCADCARAIIQSGIVHLFCPKPDFKDEAKGLSWRTAHELLAECGVDVTFLNK